MISTPVPVGADLDLAAHMVPDAEGRLPEGRFRIRAIVEFHPGEGQLMSTGHYTCWVRDRGDGGGGDSWTEYDDRSVRPSQPVLPDRVHTGAYLLAYEPVGPGPAPPAADAGAAAGQAPDVHMEHP